VSTSINKKKTLKKIIDFGTKSDFYILHS